MVSCIECAHRFGHPAAGTKRISSSPNLASKADVLRLAKPCAVHFFNWSAESLFRKVRVFELWTFTITNP